MKTVLVVEDVEINRDLMQQLLEDRYRVEFACDGPTALARAAELRPDLILMDLSLPRLDGWEVTCRLKADPVLTFIPVIALSARVMHADEERARQSGCVAFLAKPIDEALLFAALEAQLGE